jgi:16S rRNA G527 N7-methylase RsmG
VIQADAEVIAKDEAYREAFDMVVMLAVAPPERMVNAIEALLRRPGYFCTVRGGAEKIIEDSLGKTLRLRRALAGEEGVFVLYEN